MYLQERVIAVSEAIHHIKDATIWNEIQQALENITPGPWRITVGEKEYLLTNADRSVTICEFDERNPNVQENAAFLANSPQYVSYLVQEVERLRGIVRGVHKRDMSQKLKNALME